MSAQVNALAINIWGFSGHRSASAITRMAVKEDVRAQATSSLAVLPRVVRDVEQETTSIDSFVRPLVI